MKAKYLQFEGRLRRIGGKLILEKVTDQKVGHVFTCDEITAELDRDKIYFIVHE